MTNPILWVTDGSLYALWQRQFQGKTQVVHVETMTDAVVALERQYRGIILDPRTPYGDLSTDISLDQHLSRCHLDTTYYRVTEALLERIHAAESVNRQAKIVGIGVYEQTNDTHFPDARNTFQRYGGQYFKALDLVGKARDEEPRFLQVVRALGFE